MAGEQDLSQRLAAELAGRSTSIYGRLRDALTKPGALLGLGGEYLECHVPNLDTIQDVELFVGPQNEHEYLGPDQLNAAMENLAVMFPMDTLVRFPGGDNSENRVTKRQSAGGSRTLTERTRIASLSYKESLGTIVRKVTTITETAITQADVVEPEVFAAAGISLQGTQDEEDTDELTETYDRNITVNIYPSLRLARVAALCRKAERQGAQIHDWPWRDLIYNGMVTYPISEAAHREPNDPQSIENYLAFVLAHPNAQIGRVGDI